ncbi:MAG: integrase family protein [Rhodospirillaceae bacterium]|jgi:integrase|nr:integrase family protein [Rhodospirillaceae bacterium]MBT5244401.1 integrase family protein [Rhodospirillaceae bacterium]
MATIKITKGSVDQLPHPPKGQVLYMDGSMKGFGVLVSAKTKTYVAQRDIGGRTVRVTLGRHGDMTTSQAKAEAGDAIALMRKGINPNKQKRAEQGQSITLQEAANLYLGGNKKRADKTLKWFNDSMRLHLKDWLDKPLAEIDRRTVNTRHRRIGKKSGTYAANSTMRAFRAAYNRAMKQHADLPTNPTINVDWFEEKPRKTAIPAEQLADWYKDVTALPNPIRNDYYLFVLFSGLRRQSAAEIRWEHVDLASGTLLIPSPKGGEERAFVLPLSDFMLEILNRRKADNGKLVSKSPWVFPSPKSQAGHIAEPKLKPNQSAVMKVPFSIHGLRHTWMTAANAAGLSPYDIKMLANHGLPKGDVTAGYIDAHFDALRKRQQEVTDYLKGYILQ